MFEYEWGEKKIDFHSENIEFLQLNWDHTDTHESNIATAIIIYHRLGEQTSLHGTFVVHGQMTFFVRIFSNNNLLWR